MKRIFSKEFYKASIKEFTNVKSIVLMSIFVALMTVIGGVLSLNPFKIANRTVSLIFIFLFLKCKDTGIISSFLCSVKKRLYQA